MEFVYFTFGMYYDLIREAPSNFVEAMGGTDSAQWIVILYLVMWKFALQIYSATRPQS